MTAQLDVALELKALNEREFTGYGSIFGNVDLGGDIVMRGAFKRSLAQYRKAGRMPRMFFMHDAKQVPGVWLDMREDDKGLFVKGRLIDTTLGNDVREMLRSKAISGLSIGYQTRDADFDDDGNRLLKEIDLWEVSLASLAMNPDAEVSAVKDIRALEGSLRDEGLSRSDARKAVSVLKSFQRDAGTPGTQPRDEVSAEGELLTSITRLTDKIGAASLKR